MGTWTADDAGASRTSEAGQKDSDGEVRTDTLHLNVPADRLGLRLTMSMAANADAAKIKLLTVCFANTSSSLDSGGGDAKAYGMTVSVPEFSQMPYEHGQAQMPLGTPASVLDWVQTVRGTQFCSPTSLSMVLDYWSEKDSTADTSVPRAIAGVYDEAYEGTGNWAFNAAYAGSFEGMRAYVTRISSIGDLEGWIAAGIPVICSVSYHLLEGKPANGPDGHLVVLVGFTASGDPVFNDPGRSEAVRQVCKRADFLAAWGNSRHTVYLVYPEGSAVPASRFGQWLGTGPAGR